MNLGLYLTLAFFAASASAVDQLGPDLTRAEIRVKRQDDESTGCSIQCLSTMVKGISALTQITQPTNPVETGSSFMCGKYKKEDVDSVCKEYEASSKCLGKCTDGILKNMTMSGLGVLKFMCVDRKADFEKVFPCVSNSCSEIEQSCKPTCGVISNQTKEKLADILGSLTGGERSQPAAAPAGGGQTNGGFGNIDLFGMRSTVAENCRYAGCFMNCSRPLLTAKCGAMAYELYEGLIWRVISTGTDVFAQAGLDNLWPQECKTFTTTYQTSPTQTPAGANETTANTTPSVQSTTGTLQTSPKGKGVLPTGCANETCGPSGTSTVSPAAPWQSCILGILIALLSVKAPMFW